MALTHSIQPSRQRYARYNANLHQKKKLLHAHLAKELRAKLGVSRNAVLLHKGDKVRLRNGDDKGKSGTVMEVDYGAVVIFIEGIVGKNARGVEKLRPIQPSNVEIIDGDFSKKDRAAMLARGKKKMGGAAKTSAPVSKPSMPAQAPTASAQASQAPARASASSGNPAASSPARA